MDRIKLVVADKDINYLDQFMDYIRSSDYGRKFSIKSFTREDALDKYLRSSDIFDVILAAPDFVEMSQKALLGIPIIVLQESAVSGPGNLPEIFKYQALSQLLSQVLSIYLQENESSRQTESGTHNSREVSIFPAAGVTRETFFEGYTCDYIEQNGRFLLISKEAGLEIGDIDALQKNMLYSNSIDRMLNLEVEERDFAVRLRYAVGPRRSLKNVLCSRSLSRNEFYQVLLDTINTIQSSRDYMLNSRNFLLLSDFIFVDSDLSDLHFVYLPLKDLPGKKHITEEFEQIILELSQCTDGLRQQEQTMLINFCRDREQFSPGNLGRIIIATQGEEEQKPDISPSQMVREPVVQRPVVNEMAAALPVETHLTRQAVQPVPAGKTSASEKKGKAPKRLRTISLTVAAVALAAIWKIYMGRPGGTYLYICIGASILVAAAVFVLLKLWPWGNNEIQAPGSAGDFAVEASLAQPVSYQSLPVQDGAQDAPASLPYSPVQTPIAGSQAAHHPECESEKTYYDSLPDHSSITSPSNETGLLNIDEVVKPAATGGVWLEVERGGVKERLPVEGNSFVVGRKGSAVDYVETGSGVSRVHMELVKTDAGWIVRDLDSKNGTFINGEKLIANKDYPLEDGCRLKMATVEYTFHID